MLGEIYMKKLMAVLICAVLLLSFSACGEKKEQDTPSTSVHTVKEVPEIVKNSTVTDKGGLEIFDGVYLISLAPYSGKFVEDGSDDELSDILSAEIVNTTSVSYELIDFYLTFEQGTYFFSVSSLFANSRLVVLEKNRAYFPPDTKVLNSGVSRFVKFSEAPTVHLDEFRITYTDSIINVENLTDADIDNVYVYYKSMKNDVFFGGITYRVKVGTVKSGATVQTVAGKFKADSTRIVFVTYDK